MAARSPKSRVSIDVDTVHGAHVNSRLDLVRHIEQDRTVLKQLMGIKELKAPLLRSDIAAARNEMRTLTKEDLKLVKVLRHPTGPASDVMTIVLILFQCYDYKQDKWLQVRDLLGDTQTDQCLQKFHDFSPERVPSDIIEQVEQMIEGFDYEFTYDFFQEKSQVASKFCQWVVGVLSMARSIFILDNLEDQIQHYQTCINSYRVKHGGLMMQNDIVDLPAKERKARLMGCDSDNDSDKPIDPFGNELPSHISPELDEFVYAVAKQRAEDGTKEMAEKVLSAVEEELQKSRDHFTNTVNHVFWNSEDKSLPTAVPPSQQYVPLTTFGGKSSSPTRSPTRKSTRRTIN